MKLNNKGFSLIELIIVITIMAVLIGILAPQFVNYVGESKRTVDINNAQKLADAMDIATAINGSNSYSYASGTWISSIYYPCSTAVTSDGSVFGDAILSLGRLPESEWNSDCLWMMMYYYPTTNPFGSPSDAKPI